VHAKDFEPAGNRQQGRVHKGITCLPESQCLPMKVLLQISFINARFSWQSTACGLGLALVNTQLPKNFAIPRALREVLRSHWCVVIGAEAGIVPQVSLY
jgi:hypothetical protein